MAGEDAASVEIVRILKRLTFELLLRGVKKAMACRRHLYRFWAPDDHLLGSLPRATVSLIVDPDLEERCPSVFGLLGLTRLCCEVSCADVLAEYDLTELVLDGYWDPERSWCSEQLQSLQVRFAQASKVLVLTEGVSDRRVLSRSLAVLFPHLGEFFSFLDHKYGKPEMSASALVRTVKSFAAAGVANRIIAVFDNDRAGNEACEKLKRGKLPGHIAAVVLPVRDALKSYPVRTSHGEVEMDVNGWAGSIEMYLGRGPLSLSGNLLPVIAGGDPDQPQGVILDKAGVQQRFFAALEVDPLGLGGPGCDEWSDIRSVRRLIIGVAAEFPIGGPG